MKKSILLIVSLINTAVVLVLLSVNALGYMRSKTLLLFLIVSILVSGICIVICQKSSIRMTKRCRNCGRFVGKRNRVIGMVYKCRKCGRIGIPKRALKVYLDKK